MAFNLPSFINRPWPRSANDQGNIKDIFEYFLNDFYPITTPFTNESKRNLPPRVDISETEFDYNLDVELPGSDQKDIDVKVDDNILTIKGKKEQKAETKEKNYYTREIYHGSFQRSISLPHNIKADAVDAKYENGILHITIPKKTHETAKKIEVKS